MLLKDGDKEHLVWIKDYGKFQCMDYKTCKMYWCSQCLCEARNSQEKLNEHLKLCMNHEAVKAILPEKNKVNFIGDREDILKFKNYGNNFKHPFSIFIDFESTLKPIQQEESKLEEEEDEIKTIKLQEHIPNSVGIKYNCIHEKYTEPIKIRNNSNPENLLKETIETIERYAINSSKLLEQNKKPSDIKITDEQLNEHNKIKNCNYCSCSFTEENKKVMHHDHITGEFIHTICNKCNLQLKYKNFLPIYS